VSSDDICRLRKLLRRFKQFLNDDLVESEVSDVRLRLPKITGEVQQAGKSMGVDRRGSETAFWGYVYY
jgi:hypothetical protein